MSCDNTSITSSPCHGSPKSYEPGRDNFFDKLPPEIRTMIFKYLDLTEHISIFPLKGHSIDFNYHPIIPALRPCPYAYRHILAMYYEKVTVILEAWRILSEWRHLAPCYTLSKVTWELVTKLKISLPNSCAQIKGCKARFVTNLPSHIQNLPNLREIELRINLSWVSPVTPAIYIFPTAFPVWLRSYNSLRKVTVGIPVTPLEPVCKRRQICDDIIEQINLQIGVQATFERYHPYPTGDASIMWSKLPESWMLKHSDELIYCWTAKEGQVQDWSSVSVERPDSWDFWVDRDDWNFWDDDDIFLGEIDGSFSLKKDPGREYEDEFAGIAAEAADDRYEVVPRT